MIDIKIAAHSDTEILALLGRITWAESHGHYIEDKNDVSIYLNENFSIDKTKQNLSNPNNIFFIIYADALPVGYAKIEVNAYNDNIASQNSCKLERIFILNEFLPLKIGCRLLTVVEEHAKTLLLDTMWLTVYIKNTRAIKFYERNGFINVGGVNFVVNGKDYENIEFSKEI